MGVVWTATRLLRTVALTFWRPPHLGGLFIFITQGRGVLFLRVCGGLLARIGSQTTLKSNDLTPTRPMLSAIWIVTLCRPLGSSASSTNTPDEVGLACASIRLVMSIPRNPYLTRRLLTAILALAAV